MSTFVLKREYALQMPRNYIEIERDEMEYVDGGAVADLYYSAKTASTFLAGLATTWVATASGFGYATASGLVTAGVGTVIGFVGSGYSGFVATQYVSAYTDCEDIRADYGNSARVRIRTTTLFGAITKVAVTRA